MRLANGIVIDKEKTFGVLKFSALRREVHVQNEDGTVSEEIKERTYDLKCNTQGRMIQVSVPATVPLKDYNFNFRVGLGRMSELGYGMLFGSDVKKQFFQKRIKGRGYCDVGTSVISEFYTPLVPKGYDFLGTIGELAHIRQDGQVACEAKATGTD